MVIENETCHVQPRRMLRRCAGLVHVRGGHLDGCTLVSRGGGCWWDSLLSLCLHYARVSWWGSGSPSHGRAIVPFVVNFCTTLFSSVVFVSLYFYVLFICVSRSAR